jgi:hypothetical protein
MSAVLHNTVVASHGSTTAASAAVPVVLAALVQVAVVAMQCTNCVALQRVVSNVGLQRFIVM